MPFGTEVLEDGRTRFSLWAPAAETVNLILGEDTIPMPREENGTFSLTTEAGAGARYRFRIDGEQEVPDPASRSQPEEVHGASEVIDPGSFVWQDQHWEGRPWEEVVLYELHVGTFTPEGTFAGFKEKLDYLVELGVTAIELMPLSEFPGRRNWGYDGVLPFAPESAYGTPDDFKDLVQTAHDRASSSSSMSYTTTSAQRATTFRSTPRSSSPTGTTRRGEPRSTLTARAATGCASTSSTTPSTG